MWGSVRNWRYRTVTIQVQSISVQLSNGGICRGWNTYLVMVLRKNDLRGAAPSLVYEDFGNNVIISSTGERPMVTVSGFNQRGRVKNKPWTSVTWAVPGAPPGPSETPLSPASQDLPDENRLAPKRVWWTLENSSDSGRADVRVEDLFTFDGGTNVAKINFQLKVGWLKNWPPNYCDLWGMWDCEATHVTVIFIEKSFTVRTVDIGFHVVELGSSNAWEYVYEAQNRCNIEFSRSQMKVQSYILCTSAVRRSIRG